MCRPKTFGNIIPFPLTFTSYTLGDNHAHRKEVGIALKLARREPPDFVVKKRPRKQMRNDVSPKFLLNELQKSNRPGAIEEAETIFKAIALPDTMTYTLQICAHTTQF
jgi:hypothetical protein